MPHYSDFSSSSEDEYETWVKRASRTVGVLFGLKQGRFTMSPWEHFISPGVGLGRIKNEQPVDLFAELVTAEINKLRDATQLLNSVLASLSLPAAIEAGGAELPDSIRAKAAAVRAAGGLPELTRLLAELLDLLQRNKDILDEAERMLREEAEADAALRQQFGARWSRTDSAKLTEAFRANADKYRQIIDNAVRADNIVQQKFQQHRENIAVLSGEEGAISAGVPDAPDAPAPGSDADAVRTLRTLMEEVETLKAERDVIETELKDATVDLRDKFLAALTADGALDEPALSAAALGSALSPLQRQAHETLARQELLLERVQAAHAALLRARGGASQRDAALGRLAAAADAFQELTTNLNEGIKFYNDLTQLLVAFQNQVSDFCFTRKTEKDELLKDLTQEAARASQRPAPAPPQYHAGASEAGARREPPPRPPPPAAATAAGALPYPAQPQGITMPHYHSSAEDEYETLVERLSTTIGVLSSLKQDRFTLIPGEHLNKATVAGIRDADLGRIKNGQPVGGPIVQFNSGINTGYAHIKIGPKGAPNSHIKVPDDVIKGAKVISKTLLYAGITLTVADALINIWLIGIAYKEDVHNTENADEIISELEVAINTLNASHTNTSSAQRKGEIRAIINHLETVLKDVKRCKKVPVKTIKTMFSFGGSVAGGMVGGSGGVWAGAQTGAMIGAFFGPVGAVIGAPVGAIVGGFVGGMAGSYHGSKAGEALADAVLKLND